jgi:hypothetical protein
VAFEKGRKTLSKTDSKDRERLARGNKGKNISTRLLASSEFLRWTIDRHSLAKLKLRIAHGYVDRDLHNGCGIFGAMIRFWTSRNLPVPEYDAAQRRMAKTKKSFVPHSSVSSFNDLSGKSYSIDADVLL